VGKEAIGKQLARDVGMMGEDGGMKPMVEEEEVVLALKVLSGLAYDKASVALLLQLDFVSVLRCVNVCLCACTCVCQYVCACGCADVCVNEGIAGGMAVLGVGVALGSLCVTMFESKREDSLSVQIRGYKCLIVRGYVASGCNNIFLVLFLALSHVLSHSLSLSHSSTHAHARSLSHTHTPPLSCLLFFLFSDPIRLIGVPIFTEPSQTKAHPLQQNNKHSPRPSISTMP